MENSFIPVCCCFFGMGVVNLFVHLLIRRTSSKTQHNRKSTDWEYLNFLGSYRLLSVFVFHFTSFRFFLHPVCALPFLKDLLLLSTLPFLVNHKKRKVFLSNRKYRHRWAVWAIVTKFFQLPVLLYIGFQMPKVFYISPVTGASLWNLGSTSPTKVLKLQWNLNYHFTQGKRWSREHYMDFIPMCVYYSRVSLWVNYICLHIRLLWLRLDGYGV